MESVDKRIDTNTVFDNIIVAHFAELIYLNRLSKPRNLDIGSEAG